MLSQKTSKPTNKHRPPPQKKRKKKQSTIRGKKEIKKEPRNWKKFERYQIAIYDNFRSWVLKLNRTFAVLEVWIIIILFMTIVWLSSKLSITLYG